MGAAASLAYLRHVGFDCIRGYVHVDQAPRVLNDAAYRHGVFGEDQREILDSWGTLLNEFEARGRDTPPEALPQRLRRALASSSRSSSPTPFTVACGARRAPSSGTSSVAKRVLDPESWPLYLDAMRAYRTRDYDFRPSLSRIAVPMHVFVGMESRMYPPAGQIAIRDYVPHARLVRFSRAGHAVPAEAPIRFTRALGDFLAIPWRDPTSTMLVAGQSG